MKYYTKELELLGVAWASEHFKNYLNGSELEFVTYQKELVLVTLSSIYGKKTKRRRLTGWVNRLSLFNLKISQIPVRHSFEAVIRGSFFSVNQVSVVCKGRCVRFLPCLIF